MLGITLDLNKILCRAPDYKFGKGNTRNPKLDHHQLSEELFSRVKDVRENPWDSKDLGDIVPLNVVLRPLVMALDPVSFFLCNFSCFN